MCMSDSSPRHALLSVSDKTGLTEFAQGLLAAGFRLLSTGGTRKHLEAAGLEVTDVSSYTDFPEMLGGRVKTLHPKVFGGILARRDVPGDLESLDAQGIHSIDLVAVNLYPFEATIAKPDVAWAEAIEQIDIGGPSLIRAAGKNHASITVAIRPEQYPEILAELRSHGQTSPELRRRLAAAAFARTCQYDATISRYFAEHLESAADLPDHLTLSFHQQQSLRYGENPHQERAAFYVQSNPPQTSVAATKQLHGKELSYNNLLDLDSALNVVRRFAEPAVVVLKHNNPCGAAIADSLAAAFTAAYAGDPISAFGSIIGCNRKVDAATAEAMATPGQFLEAIIAPGFESDAFEILTTKPKWKQNVRLLEVGEFDPLSVAPEYRSVSGGLLVQQADFFPDVEENWEVVTAAQPTDAQRADLRFAWQVVKAVKSNAIVIAKHGQLLGAGAGQMSRVDSVQIAIRKSGDRIGGAVLASDAFFPFPDSVEDAAKAGVTALIQPGGSKQDPAVIEACNHHGLPMIFTGRRHFKH